MIAPAKFTERRRPTAADAAAGDSHVRRYFDPKFGAMAVKVLPGEHYVTAIPGEMLVTVLGSCVAACIRDPIVGVGGMNHFMLPESPDGEWGAASASMRYGNFAMEQLINDLLKEGARRERLEIKVFGGGNVLAGSGGIGHRNADFVEQYLKDENLPIAASDLRGTLPRRVHYFPRSGKVMMLALQRRDDFLELSREEKYKSTLRTAPVAGSAELFD